MMQDLITYNMGLCARWFLYLDALRQRGNMYYEHEAEGLPPVFADEFEYEVVLDGRTFEKPVNYALLRMKDRRQGDRREDGDARLTSKENRKEERRLRGLVEKEGVVLIIDPRAGHGPGIGGFKALSQLGLAFEYGYEVYCVRFFPKPEPNQTIYNVLSAEILFLEEIARRHPGEKTFLIGNCQGGWAAMLVAAVVPNFVRVVALHGSPISFWAGQANSQVMRIRGAVLGGKYLSSLLSDLGNDDFDGALLVSGFEDLNLANSMWSKDHKLFADPSLENVERFLGFEKWWNGFSRISGAEIAFIVEKLFLGNELEQGTLRMEDGRVIDLHNLHDMVVQVFTSDGDNITPPPQALGWIRVFTDEEIVSRNLKIIYCLSRKKIGHLAIFVSSDANNKQHREFIGLTEAFESLPPGLYELDVSDDAVKSGGVYHEDNPEKMLYSLKIHKRSVRDIEILCGETDVATFSKVSEVSQELDTMYKTFVRPWIKPFVTERSAEHMRQGHPLRSRHNLLSDRNPFMLPVAHMAPWIRSWYVKDEDTNLFIGIENVVSNTIVKGLENCQLMRDMWYASVFEMMYFK
ncbi:MAG: Poly(3-hydroxyalkanoate) synthetase [Parcubacteria group bacterium GW2011_GWD2_42_14]|nr:MAG: Poly(3-hydroxyalkanoate) synthetase [Parcubacteria group bacterium GW2011_GWD2_42_14]